MLLDLCFLPLEVLNGSMGALHSMKQFEKRLSLERHPVLGNEVWRELGERREAK